LTTCDSCGKEYTFGDWPYCPHGKPSKATTQPFVEYFDYGLGKTITSQAHRWRVMKEQGVQYNGCKGEA
jgi:hypothetical protein